MSNKPVHIGKTNQGILNGSVDVSTWSKEELLRGQRKARNGRFQGRKPKVVPIAVHQELTKRTMQQAQELLRDHLVAAVEMLTTIATDPDVSPADRLKAINLIMERVMGKVTDKVEVGLAAPKAWEQAQQAALAPVTEDALVAAFGELVETTASEV